MEQLGFGPGRLHAVLAGLVEAGGGLLLAAVAVLKAARPLHVTTDTFVR